MGLSSSTHENVDQIAYWNGPAGERWTKQQQMQDVVFAPVSRLLIDRADPRQGERIIDVGCGCGAITTELASTVGASGHVLGVDVSEPMLARATQLSPSGLPLEFVLADATTYPFAPGQADLLISRFGVMFFADPTLSFANLRKALRNKGRLTFVCWQEPKLNAWLIEPMKAVYRHVPKLPQLGPEDPGPFSFAAPERVKRILGQAGFIDVNMEPHGFKLDISAGEGIEAAVRSAAEIGPANLALEGQPDAVKIAAVSSIRESLQAHVKDNGVWLDAAVWIVTATAP
jgi:ubiquinone/menaquinone biosynthesis C-methylase UbiE